MDSCRGHALIDCYCTDALTAAVRSQEVQAASGSFDLTEEQQTELLAILWRILATFVDLGFGVDSVQTLLPALAEASAEDEADQLDEDGRRRADPMRSKTTRNAVIYCRVSSTKQTTRGDGLGSQETRCREYAKYKGYTVATVFTDDLSGSLIDRPGMKAMLAYLRKHRRDECVVIIDDISRLARGLEAHLQLRGAIANAGGSLESPSIEFGEDSDSVLVENLLASVSQHQRQKNGEQTMNRMRARVMNGYWPFACPVGYRYEKVNSHGKMLVRDELLASIVQEALEGYASGRFQIQAEVKRFLEAQPTFPKARGSTVLNQQVTNILTRPVYAGYAEAPKWDVSLRKGQHEGLVSFETYRKIQDRLAGHARVPARKNISQDFPLRGFVTCADCGTPLTACWTTGCRARYAYYLCPKHGCPSYRKSVRRELRSSGSELR